jgi:hypothetical protein
VTDELAARTRISRADLEDELERRRFQLAEVGRA